ncbi:MAG: universal stress protein [Cyclobacteriaceae bacterium]
MKKILVPIDFSKLSHNAVEFAAHLAKPMKAEVVVVHFENIPLDDTSLHLSGEAHSSGFSEDSLFNAQLFRANKKKLQDLSVEFSGDGVTVTGLQLGGGFLEGVKHFIDKNGADLIVIGTTGEASIQEFFSGNHTEQLIEHLETPVLSVQEKVDKNIKEVVLGIDLLDEAYSKKAFEMVKTLTESLNATLHIVDVVDTDSKGVIMHDLNKLARNSGLKNYMVDVIKDKKPNEALMKFADREDAGLIITLSEAKAGLHRFFQHSFATRMTKESAIPVLTINKGKLQ